MHQKSHRRNMHTSYDRQWNGGQRHIGKMSVDNVLQHWQCFATKISSRWQTCAMCSQHASRQAAKFKNGHVTIYGWYIILLVTLDVVYMYKTFDDSSFSYSWDMKWSQPLAAAPGYIISDRESRFTPLLTPRENAYQKKFNYGQSEEDTPKRCETITESPKGLKVSRMWQGFRPEGKLLATPAENCIWNKKRRIVKCCNTARELYLYVYNQIPNWGATMCLQ